MNSLKEEIKQRFMRAYPNWINTGEVERWGIELGFKASHADRRMRDLFTEGYLEKRRNGVSMDYRYLVRTEPLKPEPIPEPITQPTQLI